MEWVVLIDWIPKAVVFVRKLFGPYKDPADCRHCSGSGSCRNQKESYGSYSCEVCLNHWNIEGAMNRLHKVIACSICLGTGRYEPPAGPAQLEPQRETGQKPPQLPPGSPRG